MQEDQTSADDARRIIYGDDPANWPAADAEDPQPRDLGESIELRMLGQYVTLTRAAWLDLLDDLKPDCELAQRIRARIAS